MLSMPSFDRPRSQRARAAILTAAGELTAARGYEALTIEAIAERAGVAKTTIYRRWPNKAAVLMDAVFASSSRPLEDPDTGSAAADLRQQLSALIRIFTDPALGPLYLGLVTASQHDKALADALTQRLIQPRRASTATMLRRGIQRGELNADLDIDVAIDAIYGSIYYRMLVTHDPLTPQHAGAIVNQVFAGLRAPGRPASPTNLSPGAKLPSCDPEGNPLPPAEGLPGQGQ